MLSFPPDATFVVQFVSFFILLALLNRWLFVPFMQVFEERRQRSEGRLKAAEEDRRKADELGASVDSEIDAARAVASEKAAAIRREARLEERRILAEAEDRGSSALAEFRGEIARERDAAAGALEEQSREMARQMIDRLLDGGLRN